MTNEEKIIAELVKRHEKEQKEAVDTSNVTKPIGVVIALTVECPPEAINNAKDTYLNYIILIYISSYVDSPNTGRYDWNVYGYNDDSDEGGYIITDMMMYGGNIISMNTIFDNNVEYNEYILYLSQEISNAVLNKIGFPEDIKAAAMPVGRFLLDFAEKLTDRELIKNIEILYNDPYTIPVFKRYLENDYNTHLNILTEDSSLNDTDRTNISRLNNIINQLRERDE